MCDLLATEPLFHDHMQYKTICHDLMGCLKRGPQYMNQLMYLQYKHIAVDLNLLRIHGSHIY